MKEYKCKECEDTIKTLTKKYSCEKEVEVHKNCEYCGKDFIYIKLCGKKKRKIPKTCSKECSYKLGTQKAKQTFLDKYGVDNISKTQEFKDFMRETTVFKTDKFKENLKKRNLEMYGVEHYILSDKFKEKAKNKLIENYGVDNPAKSPQIQDKMKQTCIDRYNVSHYKKSQVAKERYYQDKIKKGIVPGVLVEHITNKEDFINFENYIKENPNQTLYEISEYFNVDWRTIKRKAKELKITHLIKNFNKFSQNEEVYQSFFENNFKDLEILYRDRKQIQPLELDFYIPSLKLAIEINPTWTHSFTENNQKIKNKNYHYEKFKMCKDKGIELISIFDWQDENKVKQFLKNKIQDTSEIIYARNSTVNIVSEINYIHKKILEDNHILGKVNNKKDSFVIELLKDEKILGFGVFYRTSKDFQIELKRLVFKSQYTVIGGASKIIKNVFRYCPEVKEIVTFSDNNLGTGNVYKKIGFEVTEEKKNSLIWSNSRKNIHIKNLSLVKQGADRLLKNFPGYVPVGQGDNLPTNQEIIASYGFLPVYDCGYTKWIYKKE